MSEPEKFEKSRIIEKVNLKFLQIQREKPAHWKKSFEITDKEPKEGLKKGPQKLVTASKNLYKGIHKRQNCEKKVGKLLDDLNLILVEEAFDIFSNQYNAWKTSKLFNAAAGTKHLEYEPSQPEFMDVQVFTYYNNVKAENLTELLNKYTQFQPVLILSFSAYIVQQMREKSKSTTPAYLLVESSKDVSVGTWGYDRISFKRIFCKQPEPVAKLTDTGLVFLEEALI